MKKLKRYKNGKPISYELLYEAYLRYVETKNEEDLFIYHALTKLWHKHLEDHSGYNYNHL